MLVLNKPLFGAILIIALFVGFLIWMFMRIAKDDGLRAAFAFIFGLVAMIGTLALGIGLLSGAI